MCSPRFSPRRGQAFTLIELLVVIVIIGVLSSIAVPVYNQVMIKSRQTVTLNNMRQVGAGFLMYAGDNNNGLPPRITDTKQDHWPKLLQTYVQNLAVYNSPIPGFVGTANQVTDPTQVVSNSSNNTDYIYNGWNEFGTYNNPALSVRLSVISQPSQTLLLSVQNPGNHQYYMDLVEGNHNNIVDKTAWPAGSAYVFCDGSARMLQNSTTTAQSSPPPTSDSYTDWLWLVNKSDPSGLQ